MEQKRKHHTKKSHNASILPLGEYPPEWSAWPSHTAGAEEVWLSSQHPTHPRPSGSRNPSGRWNIIIYGVNTLKTNEPLYLHRQWHTHTYIYNYIYIHAYTHVYYVIYICRITMLGKWGPPASHPALPQSTGHMAIFYRLAARVWWCGMSSNLPVEIYHIYIYIYIMNGILPPDFLQIYQYLSYVIGILPPRRCPIPIAALAPGCSAAGPCGFQVLDFLKKSGMIYFVYTYW